MGDHPLPPALRRVLPERPRCAEEGIKQCVRRTGPRSVTLPPAKLSLPAGVRRSPGCWWSLVPKTCLAISTTPEVKISSTSSSAKAVPDTRSPGALPTPRDPPPLPAKDRRRSGCYTQPLPSCTTLSTSRLSLEPSRGRRSVGDIHTLPRDLVAHGDLAQSDAGLVRRGDRLDALDGRLVVRGKSAIGLQPSASLASLDPVSPWRHPVPPRAVYLVIGGVLSHGSRVLLPYPANPLNVRLICENSL